MFLFIWVSLISSTKRLLEIPIGVPIKKLCQNFGYLNAYIDETNLDEYVEILKTNKVKSAYFLAYDNNEDGYILFENGTIIPADSNTNSYIKYILCDSPLFYNKKNKEITQKIKSNINNKGSFGSIDELSGAVSRMPDGEKKRENISRETYLNPFNPISYISQNRKGILSYLDLDQEELQDIINYLGKNRLAKNLQNLFYNIAKADNGDPSDASTITRSSFSNPLATLLDRNFLKTQAFDPFAAYYYNYYDLL